MDLKEELRSLLQKGYSAINDLNKTTDMTPKETLLNINGLKSQRQARDLIQELHQIVTAFDIHLQTVLQKTVDEKMKTLKCHSNEIIQCVDYMSNLCLTAENLIKENNLQVFKSFGPELKAEFLKNLKECRELKMVDYETFTSIDIEVDLTRIFQLPLVNIVSWNHQCFEKQIVQSLGFGSIETNNLPLSQRKLAVTHSHSDNANDSRTTSSENLYNKVPCSSKSVIPRKDMPVTEFVYAKQAKTKLLHQEVSHGGINSFSKSAGGKPSSVSSYPNSSAGHAQNPTYKPRHDLPVISEPVGIRQENAPVAQFIKVEKPDNDDLGKKRKSASKHSLPKRDYPTVAEQNKESFSEAVLASIKIETEDLPPVEPTSTENMVLTSANSSDTTTQPFGFHRKIAADMTAKNKKKGSSDCSMESWNSFRIEPLEMTFDLRTVMPSRIQNILGHYVQTIDGGRYTSFNHPTGVTVTINGYVVVADTGNHLVKIMDNNNLVQIIGQNDGVLFVRPSAVVTDTEGNIYVKDDRSVQIFDGSGKLLDTVGKSRFGRPYGLALAKYKSEPILVLIGSERGETVVFHYFIKGKKLKSYTYRPAEEFSSPNSKLRFLAVHDGVMLVSDLGASCMYLSDLNGHTLGSFGGYGAQPGSFKEPSGITVDAVGNWIVGDSKNNRLQVFTNDGHKLAVIALSEPIQRPSGIHLTSDGLLYVINYLASDIKVYDLSLNSKYRK
ncbi:hypothetical protein BsWGS_01663 [Bradybaena similaris]